MVPVREFSARQLSQIKQELKAGTAGRGLIKDIPFSLYSKIIEMIEEADRDGSGSIEFQEFLMLMDKAEKEKWSKKELKQVFTVFDKVTDSPTEAGTE